MGVLPAHSVNLDSVIFLCVITIDRQGLPRLQLYLCHPTFNFPFLGFAVTIDEARKGIDQIEVLLGLGGTSNPPALQTIGAILFSMRMSSSDLFTRAGYAREKMSQVENWCNILFSARKHQKWGGPERIKHFARMSCSSLRDVLRVTAI